MCHTPCISKHKLPFIPTHRNSAGLLGVFDGPPVWVRWGAVTTWRFQGISDNSRLFNGYNLQPSVDGDGRDFILMKLYKVILIVSFSMVFFGCFWPIDFWDPGSGKKCEWCDLTSFQPPKLEKTCFLHSLPPMGTHISLSKGRFKMTFLFTSWDMLVPRRIPLLRVSLISKATMFLPLLDFHGVRNYWKWSDPLPWWLYGCFQK